MEISSDVLVVLVDTVITSLTFGILAPKNYELYSLLKKAIRDNCDNKNTVDKNRNNQR